MQPVGSHSGATPLTAPVAVGAGDSGAGQHGSRDAAVGSVLFPTMSSPRAHDPCGMLPLNIQKLDKPVVNDVNTTEHFP